MFQDGVYIGYAIGRVLLYERMTLANITPDTMTHVLAAIKSTRANNENWLVLAQPSAMYLGCSLSLRS